MPGDAAAGPPPVTGATAWIEGWFLRVALGIGAAAWLALVTAEFGRLRPGLLLALLGAGAVALAAHGRFVRPLRRAGPSRRAGRKGFAAFGAATVLAGFLFSPPYETVVGEGDATVYLNLSREIAETGALVFDDPLLRQLPVEAREYLFLNRQPGDYGYGRYARFPGGFTIGDIAEPVVSSGFSPLFPVLAALFQQAAPPRGALFVAPLFAVLSVGGLFLVVARLGGARIGLLAALLAAVSLPQVWFAKYPIPETVAQFFVLAGVLALIAAFRDDRPWLAGAAGLFLGLACFAKIDMVFLLSVSLAAFVAWRLLVRPASGGRCVVFLLVAFGLMVAHNVVHYVLYPSDYVPYVRQLLEGASILSRWAEWAAGVTVVLLAAAAAALLAARGKWGRAGALAPRAVGWGLVGLLATYAVVYVTATPGRWPDTLFWLSWYLSWPVLGLGLLGLGWLLLSGRAGRADQGLTFFLVLVVVVSLHYLYDPLEPGDHILSMRRFVPVVLPGILAVASLAAGRLVDWVYFEFRAVATTALAAVLVGFVGAPGASVLGARLWDGVLDQSGALARTFPEDAAVLVSPELVGTHLQTSLTYLHGVDALVVQQDEPDDVLRDVMIDWLGSGRPVFVVLGRGGFSLNAPELVASEAGHASIDLRTLERTRERAPRELVDVSIELRILQVARRGAAAARTGVDVGNPLDDLLAGLRGFHGPERDGRGDSFRWSEGLASVAVPGGDRVSLVLAGARPPEVEPAEISVWAGPHRIADGLVLGNDVQTITLDLPASERSGATELTIRSTAFRPQSLGLSADRRSLGVRVYRVDVLRDAPDDAPSGASPAVAAP
jgi:hypothetical protein